LLERLLGEPYYALPTPKTTGKELFHLGYLREALAGLGTLSAEDVVATLTLLTARTVADAVRAAGATEVIASGGGTRNPGCRGSRCAPPTRSGCRRWRRRRTPLPSWVS